jgi:hypothetical protein
MAAGSAVFTCRRAPLGLSRVPQATVGWCEMDIILVDCAIAGEEKTCGFGENPGAALDRLLLRVQEGSFDVRGPPHAYTTAAAGLS